MNSTPKLSVCLCSDSNFLAVNILENLLSKNCIVNVITDDAEAWREKTFNLSAKNRFAILKKDKSSFRASYDYLIFCGGFLRRENAYTEFKKVSAFPSFGKAKILALFPIDIFDRNEADSIPVKDNLAVLYIGDLLGPRIELDADTLIARAMSEMVRSRRLTLPVAESVYPLFVADVAKVVSKWLFSFGPYGKQIFISGPQTPAAKFFADNQKLIGEIEFYPKTNIKARFIPKDFENETLISNPSFLLTETYKWINANWINYCVRNDKYGRTRRFAGKIRISKRAKIVIGFLALILVFPFLCLMFFAGANLVSYKAFISGDDNNAKNCVLVGKTFAVIADKESGFLAYIPGLGIIYREVQFAASTGETISDMLLSSIPLVRSSEQIFENVLGNKVYDPTLQLSEIVKALPSLYKDISLLQINAVKKSDSKVILAKVILQKIDFEKIKNQISQGEVLAGKSADILGSGEPKTYLILFQNNMELRPTGGFIGSYGLMTFDSGKLSDFVVSDVYSADGQLNGHVEPPSAIKNYLGEANWWLRDSNWDPDFPTSAQRAEWFLDKEIGRKVDGVIAVDLSPIKEMLKSTGPIFLPDYNLEITSENLYEKTQGEVQDSFFPGSHKKASFLTALSRSLVANLSKLSTSGKLSVLRSFYNAFGSRGMQVYLHDDDSQNAVYSLGWAGAVVRPDCGTGCYTDLAGFVEANVGVNKANYFVKRDVSLDVKVGSYQIDRTLTANFKNNANPALGLAGKYKAYIRLLVPSDSEVLGVSMLAGQNQEKLSPEIVDAKGRKEIGVLVEVLGGENKSVIFSWRTQTQTGSPISAYGLYVRKQAGVESYPISINIGVGGAAEHPDSRFALTRSGSYLYNAILARDFYSRLSW